MNRLGKRKWRERSLGVFIDPFEDMYIRGLPTTTPLIYNGESEESGPAIEIQQIRLVDETTKNAISTSLLRITEKYMGVRADDLANPGGTCERLDDWRSGEEFG